MRTFPEDMFPLELTSWVDGTTYECASAEEYLRSSKAQFDREGFLIKRGFVPAEECARMVKHMEALVSAQWKPGGEAVAQFRTDELQEKAQGSSDYFLDSADRVHFFAESSALAEDGSLKAGFKDKVSALNKVGHGLHVQDDVFRGYSGSPAVRELVKGLGWKDAVLPQSMYIFKQPRIGAEVTAHQDSTFLHTQPRQTCLGLWLALHDATIENGCLWVRPFSHQEPLRRRFARNPAYFEGAKDPSQDVPQMVFREENKDEVVQWEGKLPAGSWPPPCEGLFQRGFLPVECKAGDLVCFGGQLDHLSLPNRSDAPRHTFQLHLIEGPDQGITWSDTNWLQYSDGKSFPKL